MMRIVDLALKDLSQMFRDKRSLLFLVVMPIVFTFFMGFAYGNAGHDPKADNRIPLAVVNPEPDALLNKMLVGRLDLSEDIRIQSMSETDAIDALYKNDVAAVLVIPSGFSDQASAGNLPQLKLIADSTSAQGQSLYQSLRVPISQLTSAVEAARLTADVEGNPSEYAPAFELAWSKWDVNSRTPLVKLDLAVANQKDADWTGGNPYNQSSPGILVQFAIFGLVTSAQILVQERKSRTLQRLITTAMHPWQIVAGHMLAMFTITFLQTIMLVVFGQWVLKVDYLREPIGVLLVSISLGLWIASMGLLIGIVAKEEQQVILYAMIAMFLFSALGGTWFPLETTGGAFAAIGQAMPSAWAMNGLQNILLRGLGLESIWLPVFILLAYAVGFFGLAVWRFRKIEA
jgi:ABC-type transport system involved in multi-copper enzyme maturation permease subunit